MRHFPVFLNVQNKRILVTGAGECAIAKLRLLLKTEGSVVVFATEIEPQVESWAQAGTAAKAKMANVLFNIVDNLQESEFITPALVDRDPVTIAIGTEGTAPILARKIKAQIEESLPNELGLLAKLAEYFRPKASRLPMGRTP